MARHCRLKSCLTCWHCLSVWSIDQLVPSKKLKRLSREESAKFKACPKCGKRAFI